ncbi:hypothetical protein [Thalassotalea euphylliae]|uniref:hypothetical protein n=1 Tax=Thalassotalea euphylliae TaxID=1655234 RepID=UPI0015F28BA3|nr:hypothetical protein [Thalassotalea euphylliae]
MELLGVLLVVLVVIGQFVEGFSLWTYVQFFRGKETTLEKWLVRKENTSNKKNRK